LALDNGSYDRVLLLSSPLMLPDFDFIGRAPQIGLVSIAGNINHLCKVNVADLHALKPSKVKPFTESAMRKLKPDLVGLSAMSFQYHEAVERARWLKENYGVDVAMGGYHPSLMHREIADSRESRYFDYIVRGEGEGVMAQLVAGDRRDRIPGLSYKKESGGFSHNKKAPLLDLSKLKKPDRECRLIKPDRDWKILSKPFYSFGRRADGIETSRGCVKECNFCSIAQMYGKSFRTFPVPILIDQIKELKSRGVRSVGFTDDNVTLDLKRLEKICDAIIEEGLNDLHYLTQASCSGIAKNPKLIEKMARAGFKLVFIGIENIIKRNLDLFNKAHVASNTKQAINNLHDNGIIIASGLILGNPEDNRDDIWANYRLAHEYKLDSPIFYILTPYPKTVLRDELLERGLVTNIDDYTLYTGLHANVKTTSMSSEELQREVWKMAANFYGIEWMRYTVIKNVYPAWFLKSVITIIPNIARRKLGVKLGFFTEEDLFQQDMKRGVLYRHVKV